MEQEATEIEAAAANSTPKPDSEHPVKNRWDAHMRIAIGDGTFSPRYRLRPDKFFKVLDILGSALFDADSPTRTDTGLHIPPKVKLMAALRICAPRSGAYAVIDCFGVTESMCRRWLRQVILAVLDKKKECRKAGLRPSTLKEMERLADNNFRL
ncbi:unnamed protein product [Ectocarpus sp. 6 AP-2014]